MRLRCRPPGVGASGRVQGLRPREARGRYHDVHLTHHRPPWVLRHRPGQGGRSSDQAAAGVIVLRRQRVPRGIGAVHPDDDRARGPAHVAVQPGDVAVSGR